MRFFSAVWWWASSSFFGEEECLLPCEPLPLESAEPSGVFLAQFWLGFFFDFVFCLPLFLSG